MPAAAKPRAKKADANGSADIEPVLSAKNSTPIVAETIGECAGVVWCCLNDNGPQPITKLKKATDAPAELVLAAVGWLAREGKLHFETHGKQVIVALR